MQLDWNEYEQLLETGVTIDRPKGTGHPEYPKWIYPVDYGHIPKTSSSDGAEIDVFSGDGSDGLRGLLLVEHGGHVEPKLLWNMMDAEVQAVCSFLDGSVDSLRLINRS